jgi:hypothetical protein
MVVRVVAQVELLQMVVLERQIKVSKVAIVLWVQQAVAVVLAQQQQMRQVLHPLQSQPTVVLVLLLQLLVLRLLTRAVAVVVQ